MIIKPDLSAFHFSEESEELLETEKLRTPPAPSYEKPTPAPLKPTASIENEYGSKEDTTSSKYPSTTPPSRYKAPTTIPSSKYGPPSTEAITKYRVKPTSRPTTRYRAPTTRYRAPSTTTRPSTKYRSTTKNPFVSYSAPTTVAPKPSTTVDRYKPPTTELPKFKFPKPNFSRRKSKSSSQESKENLSQPAAPSNYEIKRDEAPIVLRPAYNPIPTPLPDTFESSKVSNKKDTSNKHRFSYQPSSSRDIERKYQAPTPAPTKPKPKLSSKARKPYTGRRLQQQSAPRRQYVSVESVTVAPPQEAPVYRTSTKAYRAPSSLYRVRPSTEEEVTAPAQPEFIQSG